MFLATLYSNKATGIVNGFCELSTILLEHKDVKSYNFTTSSSLPKIKSHSLAIVRIKENKIRNMSYVFFSNKYTHRPHHSIMELYGQGKVMR